MGLIRRIRLIRLIWLLGRGTGADDLGRLGVAEAEALGAA
jgi:hypothetical protein